jgi:hypothetical protein
MTAACRPPEGTRDGTWHWLRCDGRSPEVARWFKETDGEQHFWNFTGDSTDYTPEIVAILDYRYLEPVREPTGGADG